MDDPLQPEWIIGVWRALARRLVTVSDRVPRLELFRDLIALVHASGGVRERGAVRGLFGEAGRIGESGVFVDIGSEREIRVPVEYPIEDVRELVGAVYRNPRVRHAGPRPRPRVALEYVVIAYVHEIR